MDTLNRLVPELVGYARTLIDAGYTVYVPNNGRAVTFMHYSREVDGRTCYGTVQRATFYRLGEPLEHTMPIKPSRDNGSSATIGGTWGDPATLGLDIMDRASIGYANAVARPDNWCPNIGAWLANHKPDGIDTRFTAVSQREAAVQS